MELLALHAVQYTRGQGKDKKHALAEPRSFFEPSTKAEAEQLIASGAARKPTDKDRRHPTPATKAAAEEAGASAVATKKDSGAAS